MRILAIGEVLWDVFEYSETLGGAPLNFSAAARRLGCSVALLTAVGEDLRGVRALKSMEALRLPTQFAETVPERDTGTALVTTDEAGNANYFIKRPAAFDEVQLDDLRMSLIEILNPDWLYFGTLAQNAESTRNILQHLVAKFPSAKRFYDVNLRDGHWNLASVQHLSGLASVMKLNKSEAEILAQLSFASADFSLETFCRRWSSTYNVKTICITLGSDGCAVYAENAFSYFPGFTVKVADTVGAGDAFAAAFLQGYDLQWSMTDVATFANALGALVASRSGGTPHWTVDECRSFIAENRRFQPCPVHSIRSAIQEQSH